MMKGFVGVVCFVFVVILQYVLVFVIELCQNLLLWFGMNFYYFQGFLDVDQDVYIQNFVNYNIKVVRLWVNQQGKGCQKGSNIVKDIFVLEIIIGQYNKVILDEFDRVLVKLVVKNIKVVILLYDLNLLIGDYCK